MKPEDDERQSKTSKFLPSILGEEFRRHYKASLLDYCSVSGVFAVTDKGIRHRLTGLLAKAARHVETQPRTSVSQKETFRQAEEIINPTKISNTREAVFYGMSVQKLLIDMYFHRSQQTASEATDASRSNTYAEATLAFVKKLGKYKEKGILDYFVDTINAKYLPIFKGLCALPDKPLTYEDLILRDHAFQQSDSSYIIEDFDFALTSKAPVTLAKIISSQWQERSALGAFKTMIILLQLKAEDISNIGKIDELVPHISINDWEILLPRASAYEPLKKILARAAHGKREDIFDNFILSLRNSDDPDKRNFLNCIKFLYENDNIELAGDLLKSEHFEFLSHPSGRRCLAKILALSTNSNSKELSPVFKLTEKEKYQDAEIVLDLILALKKESASSELCSTLMRQLMNLDCEIPENIGRSPQSFRKYLEDHLASLRASSKRTPAHAPPQSAPVISTSARRSLHIPEQFRAAHDFFDRCLCGRLFRLNLGVDTSINRLVEHHIKDSSLWGSTLAPILKDPKLKSFYFERIIKEDELNSLFEEIMKDPLIANKHDEVFQLFQEISEHEKLNVAASTIEPESTSSREIKRNTSPKKSFSKIIAFVPLETYSSSKISELEKLCKDNGVKLSFYDSDTPLTAKSALQNTTNDTLIIRPSAPISHSRFYRIKRLTPAELRGNLLCCGDLNNLDKYIKELLQNRKSSTE